MRTALVLAAALGLPDPARGQTVVETSAGRLQITRMADGLDEPWGIGFLPDGSFLVTERGGRLHLVGGGITTVVGGVPDVQVRGQGGLLDVMIPRDFATSREVWLSYAAPLQGGSATAVGRGVLSADGTMLQGFATVHAGDPVSGAAKHYGARVVEAPDGTIFLTTGERGTGPAGLQAQDPGLIEGKVIHLNRDGTPAVHREGWRPGVYSLGHRNAQGAAIGPDGVLWLVEHGAQGGDEVNRVIEGANYGWPVVAYGENYGGGKIGIGSAAPGMQPPEHYWDPSIAPSGMLFYSGALVPEWAGHLFTGSLKFNYLARLDPEAGFAEERIAARETGRVRDVVEAPDGSIWFLSVTDGAVYRMAPAG